LAKSLRYRGTSRQRRRFTDSCICGIVGALVSGSPYSPSPIPTSEPFLVLALMPKLRGFALGWWRGVFKLSVKFRGVHIHADLGKTGGITVGRLAERRIKQYRLFFITDYCTFFHKVSRNPHDFRLVVHCPRLDRSKRCSPFCMRAKWPSVVPSYTWSTSDLPRG
jgi:hypothetical protein